MGENDLTADAVPVATPSMVERVGGTLCDGGPASHGGPLCGEDRDRALDAGLTSGKYMPPMKYPVMRDGVRMGVIEAIVNGGVVSDYDLTVKEKAYLVRHEWFRDRYDARLFDAFVNGEEMEKGELKIMDLVGQRVGAKKPGTQVNVQVNNPVAKARGGGPVSIRVRK